ncbi:Prefoldin beta-like protein [Terfezia boudieri ATCC MYA-4762]|uniref:Prefoldin beta-like protein n=1 Tax=Terfezia boudieri ATCC MYA-4762 TaxID=1051890 RepID=A0A3N4LWM5_9PEZI|nr:Prefoldin beta-like protein [Terfezia boudieri ATCC MYA-4762]
MASQSTISRRQQELQLQYSNYKNSLQQLASKIGDIEQETEEHKLVLDTLAPISKDRKCFRLINGVLVERTVCDVVPALESTAEGLKKVLEGLVKDYKKKQEEMEEWKTKNNIQVVSQ